MIYNVEINKVIKDFYLPLRHLKMQQKHNSIHARNMYIYIHGVNITVLVSVRLYIGSNLLTLPRVLPIL